MRSCLNSIGYGYLLSKKKSKFFGGCPQGGKKGVKKFFFLILPKKHSLIGQNRFWPFFYPFFWLLPFSTWPNFYQKLSKICNFGSQMAQFTLLWNDRSCSHFGLVEQVTLISCNFFFIFSEFYKTQQVETQYI